MKKLTFTFSAICLFLLADVTFIYPQYGWHLQQSGISTALNDVYFVNNLTG